MVSQLKHWLNCLFHANYGSIHTEYTILLLEISRVSNIKELRVVHTKMRNFNLQIEKLNSPSYGIEFSKQLQLKWNQRYKLIQLKLRG